jgi:hypothetical protein
MQASCASSICNRREHFTCAWCLHKHSGTEWGERKIGIAGDRLLSLGSSALNPAPRATRAQSGQALLRSRQPSPPPSRRG